MTFSKQIVPLSAIHCGHLSLRPGGVSYGVRWGVLSTQPGVWLHWDSSWFVVTPCWVRRALYVNSPATLNCFAFSTPGLTGPLTWSGQTRGETWDVSIMRDCQSPGPGVGDEVFIPVWPGLCVTLSLIIWHTSPGLTSQTRPVKIKIISQAQALLWLAPGFFCLGMIMMIIMLLNECIYRS